MNVRTILLVALGLLVASHVGCRHEPIAPQSAHDLDPIEIPLHGPILDRPLVDERITAQRPIIRPEKEAVLAAELRTLDLRYDPANEITIRGPVLGKRYINLEGDHTGEVVRLQPGGDFVEVLIGTTKHLFHHDIDVGITDQVLVTGSLVEFNGRRLLLARELWWSDRELPLRDEDGWPLWRDRSEREELEAQVQ